MKIVDNLKKKCINWIEAELKSRHLFDVEKEEPYDTNVKTLKDTVFTPIELKTLEMMKKEEIFLSILEKIEIHSTMDYIHKGGDQKVHNGIRQGLGLIRDLIQDNVKKAQYHGITQERIN